MDRKIFMRELEFLLQDINQEERQEALSFYEDYFDEAGVNNEQKVIDELGDPTRVAAIIKAGLKGHFDEHIHVGSDGFANDDYKKNYEVVDAKETKETKQQSETGERIKKKWNDIDSRDRFIFIVLAILAIFPVSFSFFGIFGGIFGVGFSIVAAFLCFVFGFWIITFVCHLVAFVLIVTGVVHLFIIPGVGFIYIGVGCILMGIGTIFGKIASWFFRDCIPNIFNAIADGLAKIFHPRGA